jgi:hypothetical protein
MAMMRRIVTLGWVLPALASGLAAQAAGAPAAQAAGAPAAQAAGAPAARAAASADNRPGASCGNGSISALNQYCEQIPAATGRQTPRVGTPALGGTPAATAIGAQGVAPRGIVSAAARRRLRSIPAAVRSHPIAGSVTGADIWSLSVTLMLILVALALALVAVAYRRWRRQRPA